MSKAEPDPGLRDLTAVQLRQYARDEGLRITHLAQRRKDDLVVLIEKALSERQHTSR